jgi:2-phospho-L-lactate guanylyltransferase
VSALAGGIWAVVPAKNSGDAKQRLAPVLDRSERADLYRAMLEDVLAALRASTRLSGTLVVTADPELAALASRYGARVLDESDNRGHTAAVAAGAAMLAAAQARALLTIPGDVPLVTARDIDTIIGTCQGSPRFRIVPDRAIRGSNAILCAPPGLVPLQFGDDSFAPHLAAARSLGIEPDVLRLPDLALDVDRPDDLRAFIAAPSTTRSRAYLDRTGVSARLRAQAATGSNRPLAVLP